jgi:hypothetical protein
VFVDLNSEVIRGLVRAPNARLRLRLTIDLLLQSRHSLDDAIEWRDFTEDHHPHAIVVLLQFEAVRLIWSST